MKWKKDNKLPNTKNVRRKNGNGQTQTASKSNKPGGSGSRTKSGNNNSQQRKNNNNSPSSGLENSMDSNVGLDMADVHGNLAHPSVVHPTFQGHPHPLAHLQAQLSHHHVGAMMEGPTGVPLGHMGSGSISPLAPATSPPGLSAPVVPPPPIKSDYGLTAL